MNKEREYLRRAALRRASRMIEADKSEMNEECRRMAIRDFYRVAQEYFDVDSDPEMRIEKEKGAYTVTLSFTADRIKTFFALK